jgi:hypothetical protein
MVHCIPISKNDSLTVATAYLENVRKYHAFKDDVLSDRKLTFTGSFFMDLYNLLVIQRCVSTAYHCKTDGQTEHINQVIEAYL